jgi:hypothetical protein
MTTGRINQVAFLWDTDAARARRHRVSEASATPTVVRVKGLIRTIEGRGPRAPIIFRIREHKLKHPWTEAANRNDRIRDTSAAL